MKPNPNSEKNNSLHSLFINQLKTIYGSEQVLIKSFPQILNEVTSSELKEALEEHLDIIEVQVKRLDEVFSMVKATAVKGASPALEGLTEEFNEIIKNTTDAKVKDAAIIAVVQKIKHYEIASYGCLRTWARVLGNEDAADLLQITLDEQEEVDEKLTEIAEASINEEAFTEAEPGEE